MIREGGWGGGRITGTQSGARVCWLPRGPWARTPHVSIAAACSCTRTCFQRHQPGHEKFAAVCVMQGTASEVDTAGSPSGRTLPVDGWTAPVHAEPRQVVGGWHTQCPSLASANGGRWLGLPRLHGEAPASLGWS